MNQKKAKNLRRIAKATAEARFNGSLPNVSYEVGQLPKFEARRVMRLGTNGLLEATDEYVKPFIFDKVAKGVPKILGFCTRKIYQDMKKLNG